MVMLAKQLSCGARVLLGHEWVRVAEVLRAKSERLMVPAEG